jgi:hypothetical protein
LERFFYKPFILRDFAFEQFEHDTNAPEVQMLGQTIFHYKILEKLGGDGISFFVKSYNSFAGFDR